MSISTSNSSPSLSSVQKAALKAYTKAALIRRDQFTSDGEWARTFARNFYHGVDKTVGFLPVYHSLMNALYNTIAEKSTTVKAQAEPTTKAHEHPLLPTLQTQSESFAVKMDKLFKYAWPLRSEYRSLERWAKVQAAQWQMKGNVSHKLSDVTAKLLEMAEEKMTPNYVKLATEHWNTRKNFTSNTAWAKETAKHVYEQLGKSTDLKTIENGLNEIAKIVTAPVMPEASLSFAHDFDRLAQEALASLHNFTDESAWARATARNFFHQFNATTPFITIYSKLLHYADLKAAADDESEGSWNSDDESEHDEDEDYETESEDEEDEEDDDDLSYTSDESMENADTLFTPKGKQTDAGTRGSSSTRHPHPSTKDEEAHAGRIAMDRILFKQYREWFAAFKEEEDDEFSAEDRFSWHCAKILSNNTGLDREMCQTVVGGWLELHKNTLETV